MNKKSRVNLVRIYLVRHGQSEANLTRTIQGTLDSPLTQLGRKQAAALSDLLPDTFDRVYVSNLTRAKETGFIATGLSASSPLVRTDPRLSEIHFGELQGQPYSDFPAKDILVRQHVQFVKDALNGTYGAERVADFLRRTQEAFEDIVFDMDQHGLNQVAIFTHGGVLRSIIQHYFGFSDEKWLNCEYGILDKTNGTWHFERYSDHIIDK